MLLIQSVVNLQHQNAAPRMQHHVVRAELFQPDRHVHPHVVIVLQLAHQAGAEAPFAGREFRFFELSSGRKMAMVSVRGSGGLQGGFDERCGKAGLPGAGLGEVGLEVVAKRHQFIDFGNDAVLFIYWRQRHDICG